MSSRLKSNSIPTIIGLCGTSAIAPGATNEAGRKNLGLWQQANPIPPWEFRKRLRKGRE